MQHELSSVASLLFALAATVACHGSVGLKQGELSTRPCGKDAVIDNAEDGDGKILQNEGRGGKWYTYADKAGSTIEPAPGGPFTMTPGGVSGKGMSAHMSGTVTNGGEIFAGMGLDFTESRQSYDASKYGGLAFFAKKGSAPVARVHVKIPDVNTDPAGKVCTKCSNDFGAYVDLTSEWTRYEVPFYLAQQEKGWGIPQPSSIAADQIYGIKWQVSVPGAKFDIWVDDVTFIGCE
jgi:endoglucanase